MGGIGNRRSRLLPIMCSKPSIKDVIIVPKWRQASDEPPSPRVGCMGQVVKRTNSRVIAYPTLNNCNLRAQIKLQRIKNIDSVADMDPPLPVIKKQSTPKPESLWKRRSKGRELQIQVCPNFLPLQPKRV